jgi:uncharacterized membrane protein HdeD (DUF308 family)
MSSASVTGIVRKATGFSIFVSFVLIVAGIVAIAMPLEAGIAVNLIVGWMLIFSAVAHFIYGWFSRGAGAVILKLLVGVLSLAVGIYLLEHPARGLATLTLALAIFLAIEGVLGVAIFLRARSAPGRSWHLLDGIITLVLALLIWRTWPSNSEWVLGTLVGISMLISGITRLMLSLAVRRVLAKTA